MKRPETKAIEALIDARKPLKKPVEIVFISGFEQMRDYVDHLENQLNTPELEDFAKGVVSEAQHQRHRWGTEHDASKTPEDWYWTLGYLAGKALSAQRSGDRGKLSHHLITCGALLANQHASQTLPPKPPEPTPPPGRLYRDGAPINTPTPQKPKDRGRS